MMRRLAYGLMMILLLLSCRREELSWTGPYLEIALQCDETLLTKAEEEDNENIYSQEGVDGRLHENLLKTVDVFFYPASDTLSDATYHVSVDYGEEGKIKSDILRLPMNTSEINTLIFPSQEGVTRCYVYAVVNYHGPDPEHPQSLVSKDNEGQDILTGTSLPEIKAKSVTTNFITPGGSKPQEESRDNRSHYHSDFMMSGSALMVLRGRNQYLAGSATIALKRYACKMTVGVNVVSQVPVGNEVWEPMLESMEIYLVDAVSNTTLDGRQPDNPSYINFRGNSMKFMDLNGGLLFDKVGDYYQTYPFYMYPQHWKYGSTKSPDKEPYLKLVLPWKRVLGGYAQKQFYYKVFIPDDYREKNVRQFVRNNWYHINIDVSILGAETDDDKVTPAVSVYVVDWQDKNVVIKNADIGKARYLSVEQDEYTIFNQETARLPYVSSHPVLMKEESIRVGRIYYGTADVDTDALGGTIKVAGANDLFPEGTKYIDFSLEQRKELNNGEDWFEDKESAIVFKHKLINNYKDPSFDYSYYKIQFTLVHADLPNDTQYLKEQTILQYPAIYLDRTPNPDKIVDKGNSSTTENGGYVYINDGQYSQTDYDNDGKNTANLWKVVCYNGGGTDMYKINVTVLPSDSDFTIGDPRSSTSVLLRNDYNDAYYITEDGQVSTDMRSLKDYYPTEESSRTANMIAPSYRISTKLSGTYRSTRIDYNGAKARCAAFQENGFPAGRWRLPTMAEISFSAQLSANGVYTSQFSAYYWSANGAVYVEDGSGVVTPAPTNTTAFVRCVYDSWYWGDDRVLDNEGKPSIFVWGDAKR